METTQPRIMRAYAILAKGDQPKPLGNDNYLVKRQSGNGNYLVTLVSGGAAQSSVEMVPCKLSVDKMILLAYLSWGEI